MDLPVSEQKGVGTRSHPTTPLRVVGLQGDAACMCNKQVKHGNKLIKVRLSAKSFKIIMF